MSSRLAYQSPEFTAAAADPQDLQKWEETQFALYRKRTEDAKTSQSDLLACSELAIRNKDASCAQSCLERSLKLNPQEADAVYLQALLALAQNQSETALSQLEALAPTLPSSGADSARVWRLLAQERLRQKSDLPAAVAAFAKACEVVQAPDFLHTTTRSSDAVSADMLSFDFLLFDRLYAWEGGKAPLRLVALATGPQDQLYLLDNYNRLIFQFDANGKFERGISERQLAMGQFLHPEARWELSDLCVGPNGHIYLAGNRDVIGVFSPDWKLLRTYSAPASNRPLRPISLAVDAQNQLYVLYLHMEGIHVFNAQGFHEGAFGNNTTMPQSGKNYYCGLAVDKAKRIYLYDREKVQVFHSETREWLKTLDLPAGKSLDDGDYPFCWNGAAIDPDGLLWLADTANNRVLNLKEGEISAPLPKLDPKLQNLSHPFDITFDSQGRLYLADTQRARVLKYEAQKWSQVFGHPTFEAV
jgi:streptogramin lyase